MIFCSIVILFMSEAHHHDMHQRTKQKHKKRDVPQRRFPLEDICGNEEQDDTCDQRDQRAFILATIHNIQE